ncbi:hypothetical protein U9M48_044402 [Paspalum notatum var. saurae]|uniref:Uncharacterized protein n=1 Tax=Paspalum notatum var. saurae TaxID=547442 RepID=A0AAQ3UV73_PASNO
MCIIAPEAGDVDLNVPEAAAVSSTGWKLCSCLKFSHTFSQTLASYSFLPPPGSFTSTVKWCMVPATTCCLTFTSLSNSSIAFCTYHTHHH